MEIKSFSVIRSSSVYINLGIHFFTIEIESEEKSNAD